MGPEATDALWSMVQHHRDLSVQRTAAEHLADAVALDAAPRESLALLLDRIAVREGRRQRYGTQYERDRDGVWRRCLSEPNADPPAIGALQLPPGESVDSTVEIRCRAW